MPENLQNEVFEKVGELAKTDKMNKNEVIAYLKSLYDMNIVQNEIRRISAERDDARAIIAIQINTLAQKDDALQKAYARIAELEKNLT